MSKRKTGKPPSDRETRVFPPTDGPVRKIDGFTIGGAHPPEPLPVPDVHVAVGPEAIDEELARGACAAGDACQRRDPFLPDPEAPRAAPTLPSPSSSMDGAAKGIRWDAGPIWSDRIERMAEARGLSVPGFLESLLRRAWVSTPAGLRKGQ